MVRREAGTIVEARELDRQLVELWLHGRGVNTLRAYRRAIDRFEHFTKGKPIRLVTLAELQQFAAQLDTLKLAPASRHNILAAVKSLFAFAAGLKFIPFDTAKPLHLPSWRDTLADRILEEADVAKMLAVDASPRDRLILELLYVAGVRRSELCGLKWRDARPHRGAAVLTVFGKGGKTRHVRIEAPTWSKLLQLRDPADVDQDPIFRSRKGGHLDPSQIVRIVKRAAARAGVTKHVSPHWLRHCHASHALDNGAPIHLVSATLGHSSLATTSRYVHARPNESSASYLPKIP